MMTRENFTANRAKFPRGLLAVLLAVMTAAGAAATTLVRMDLDELTRTAAVVARARCLGSSARWEGGHMWTLTKFKVTEVWKSKAPQTIVVRLVGGQDGQRTVHVDGVPRFQDGEEVVLFLEPSPGGELTVAGWAQGAFRIRRDPRTNEESVAQDTSGLGVFDPGTRGFRAGGARRMALREFKERVLRAASGAAGRKP
jgi:hypothetical protein